MVQCAINALNAEFPFSISADTSRLKGLTYTTIASLAQRKPELFQQVTNPPSPLLARALKRNPFCSPQDLAVFKLLSAAISTEKEAVKSFVQEALGTLTHAYYAAPEETLVALKALLLENVEKVPRVFSAHVVFVD